MIFTRGLRVCLAAQPADLRRGFEGSDLSQLLRSEVYRSPPLKTPPNPNKSTLRQIHSHRAIPVVAQSTSGFPSPGRNAPSRA
jgi:hypothetical protein